MHVPTFSAKTGELRRCEVRAYLRSVLMRVLVLV
jgi:hypothetical protein